MRNSACTCTNSADCAYSTANTSATTCIATAAWRDGVCWGEKDGQGLGQKVSGM